MSLLRTTFRPTTSKPLNSSTILILKSKMSSPRPFSSYIVTPQDLHTALSRQRPPSKLSTSPRIIPLCASWFLPNSPHTGAQVFLAGHIPTARFFDLDAISDPSSPYPHMLPPPSAFADAMSRLGIRRDDEVVVYDSKELGIFSAPRVGWTLRVFGHPNVHVLDNFRVWCEMGLPVEEGEQKEVERSRYPVPEVERGMVAGFEEVREVAVDSNKEGREGVQVLDARSLGRWRGTEPEPRPGLSSGHMPGSISVPVTDLLDPKTKSFLSPSDLRAVFESKGVDPSKPVISSCGTGVTATIIDTAIEIAGYSPPSKKVYDGSWTEWAQRVQPTENLIKKEA